MQRFGADLHNAREMAIDDILLCRTELLTHMTQDYLEGAPHSDFQKQAMAVNAAHIEMACDRWMENEDTEPGACDPDMEHNPCRRLMRLAQSMNSVARGRTVDNDHKTTMQNDAGFIAELCDSDNQENMICLESHLNILLLGLLSIF